MVTHSCSFVHDNVAITLVIGCFVVLLFKTVVLLAVARGSCVMSSRQSSRADLGGIPEGDPIENKVCLFLLFLCFTLFLFLIAICCFVLAFVLF